MLLIRQIYERAEQTIIWLGCETLELLNAFSLILNFSRSKQAYEVADDKRNYAELVLQNKGRPLPYELPFFFDERAKSLSTFLRKGWFTRVWIIQELAVSQLPVLVVKHFEMAWDPFADAVKFAVNIQFPLSDTLAAYNVLQSSLIFGIQCGMVNFNHCLSCRLQLVGSNAPTPEIRYTVFSALQRMPDLES